MRQQIILFFTFTMLSISAWAQPSLTSITPSNGPVGSLVTIMGSGFDNTPSNNQVFIGGELASVNTASINQLVVTIPNSASGKSNVTVVNLVTNSQVISDLQYTVTFSYGISTSSAASAQYVTQNTNASGPNLTGESTSAYSGKKLVSGDFDLDGKIDFMAQSTTAANSINLYPNTNSTVGAALSSSSFSSPTAIGLDANSVTTALDPYDLNSDGLLDVLIGRTNGFTVLENGSLGTGSFVFNKITYSPTGTYASQRCVAADLDRDGLPEVICINMTGTTLSIYKNTSSGGSTSFNTTPTNLTLPYSCGDLITADLDNDGDVEIIVSTNGKFGAGNYDGIHYFNNTNSVSGTISMATSTSIYTSIPAGSYSSFAVMLGVADLDQDNDMDIVAISKGGTGSSLAWVMRNNGSMSFTTFNVGSYYFSYALIYTVRLGDINGDGKIDIVFHEGNSSGKILAILNKYSSGTLSNTDFSTYSEVSTSWYIPVGFTVDDFNQDGKIDIITNQYWSNNLTYMTNGNSIYFAKAAAAGTLYLTSSWSNNFDGTGASPSNFTSGTFVLDNLAATTKFTTGGAWSFGASLSIPAGKTMIITASTATTISGSINNSGYIYGDASSTLNLSGSAQNTGDANFYNLTVKTGSSSINFTGSDSVRNTLSLESSSTLNINSASVYLYGGISNSGTIAGNSGTNLYLYGTSSQSLGAASGIGSLTLNNNSGASIGSNLTIGNSLTLSNGILSIGTYNLTLNGMLMSSGSTAYVQTNSTGKMAFNIDNGNSAFFPIGNTAYNPVEITNNTGAIDNFAVRVIDEVYNNGLTGYTNNMDRIRRTWDIHKTSANNGSGVDFTFYWNNGEEAGSLITPVLNHYNGTYWETPTLSSSSSTSNSYTAIGYTGTFSPFAIGNGLTPLAAHIIDFKAKAESTPMNMLTWTSVNEEKGSNYRLMASSDGKVWEVLNETTCGLQTLNNYQYAHKNPENYTYYKLQVIEGNNVVSSSKILVVNRLQSETAVTPYPNPSNGTIQFTTNEESDYSIIDNNGRIVASGTSKGLTSIDQLSAGVYILQINSSSTSSSHKFIVN